MASRGIVIKIEGDGASAARALEMVQEHLRETAAEAKESGGEIAESMEMVKRALETVGLYMGIRETIDGLKELTRGSMELGVELGHLHEQTGISTQNLSVMKYMADSTGVGVEALSKGFKKFSTEIRDAEEGKKQAIESFQRLGVTQKEVTKGGNDLYGMLGTVADRFKEMPDGPLKMAAATDLFGRSGLQLIPILDQGRAGIESYKAEAQSLGLVLDEAGIQKMEELHQATVRLEGAFQGAGLGLTAGMEPALVSLDNAIAHATSTGDGFGTMGQKIGDIMLGGANAAAWLAEQVRGAWDELSALDSMVNADVDKFLAVAAGAGGTGFGVMAQDQVDKEKAALDDRKKIEQNYEDFANNLARSTMFGPDAEPTVQLANGNLAAKRPPKKAGVDGDWQPTPVDQGPKPKSDDSIQRAAADLVEEQGRQMASASKAANDQLLADLDSYHKLGLVSDADYYQEKAILQQDSFDQEEKALETRQKALQDLYAKQHGDKTLHRDKSGQSAEELRTERELLQVQEQMDALQTKRTQAAGTDKSESSAAAKKDELESLRQAAELEKQRNAGITAQIALIRREKELEAQRITGTTGNSQDGAEVIALGEIEVKKLQIEQLTKQITAAENVNKLAVEGVADAAKKDPRLRKSAAQETNALNAQTAAQLKVLVQEYDALAQQLGGPYMEKAKELHAELNKLNTPDKKGDAQFQKTLADGVSSMADRIADSSLKGKNSFHDMAKSMEQDVADLLIKLATQAWLTPLLSGTNTSGSVSWLPQHAEGTGNAGGGPMVVGEKGPEVWQPPQRGGAVISNKDLAGRLSGGGGGGRGINVTHNIINQSSQPVSSGPPKVDFDEQSRSMVITTVLHDLSSGGQLAQALGK